MKSYCVYCHTNKINGKKYFGITSKKPHRRWESGNGYKTQPHFWNSIQKYGWSNFEHEIIMDGLSSDGACMLEEFLIRTYDTTDPSKGYNVCFGGQLGTHGVKKSEETLKKISESTKQRWQNEEYRKKVLDARKSYVTTDEHRKNISKALKGHKVNIETRAKLSHSMKTSEKYRQNRKTWNKGKHYTEEQKDKYKHAWEYTSEETKKQISNSVKQLWANEEYRQHMRKAHLNKGCKKVICLETNQLFNSLKEAEQLTNIKYDSISACLHGRIKTAGGYHWKFA